MNRTASAALGAVVVHFVIAIRSSTWVEIARSAIDGASERLAPKHPNVSAVRVGVINIVDILGDSPS